MKLARIAAFTATTIVVATVFAVAQQGDDATARADEFLAEIESAPYTEWAFQPNVPEGYYVGVEPHGMILRVFVNDVALQDTRGDATRFSEGAVIVKENHMPGGTDISGLELQEPVDGFDGDLDSLTFMVKVDGYNPDAGDWFWVKTASEGGEGFDAAGTPEGCIACHSQVEDQDYVFNAGPGGS